MVKGQKVGSIKTNELIYQDSKITKFLIESPKYGNFEVVIDSEDWIKINQHRWHVIYYKHVKAFYVTTNVKLNDGYFTMPLHRLIFGIEDSKIMVDHADHDTLNNTKNNLRICEAKDNKRNGKVPKNNSSGYKGVYLSRGCKTNPWEAQIRHNKKLIRLGYFPDKISAALAYNEAAIKYFGEFACLNEIQ